MINWIYNIYFSVSRGCLTCRRTTLCVLVSWCPPAHTGTGPPPPPTAPSTPSLWCPPGTAGPTEIPTVRPAMARTSVRPSAPQAGPSVSENDEQNITRNDSVRKTVQRIPLAETPGAHLLLPAGPLTWTPGLWPPPVLRPAVQEVLLCPANKEVAVVT